MEELDGTRGLVFESLRPDQPKHSQLFNLQGDPHRGDNALLSFQPCKPTSPAKSKPLKEIHPFPAVVAASGRANPDWDCEFAGDDLIQNKDTPR